jgi:hypothetical protein
MFDMDIAGMDATETLAAAAEAHAVRTDADRQLIELSLHFADLYPDPATIPGHESLPGGERAWHQGGPGCPGFAEFAAAEFGAVIGRSAGSAAAFMGQSLALRHRFPQILSMVRSGHGEPWKARSIATACLALSVQAAAIVDRRVAGIIDAVTPLQLEKIVKAASQQADPEQARATADRKAKERGVWAGHTDEHGTTSLHIRAATGAVIRLKTTLRRIADVLAELGDTGTLQERLARAVDIISDPALTHELLNIAHHLTKTTPTTPADADTTHATPDSPTGSRPGPDSNLGPNIDTGPGPDAESGQDVKPRPNAETTEDPEPSQNPASEPAPAASTEPEAEATDSTDAADAADAADATDAAAAAAQRQLVPERVPCPPCSRVLHVRARSR